MRKMLSRNFFRFLWTERAGHKNVRIPEVLRLQRDIMRDTHVVSHHDDVDLEIIVHNGEIMQIRSGFDEVY